MRPARTRLPSNGQAGGSGEDDAICGKDDPSWNSYDAMYNLQWECAKQMLQIPCYVTLLIHFFMSIHDKKQVDDTAMVH